MPTATRKQIPEEEIISGLIRKDQSVMEYLYDHYSGALYSVVLRVVRNEDIAQEVLHDAFLKIWDKIDSYDPAKGRLFTWMLNLSRNLAIDKTRSKEMSKGKRTDDLDLLVNKLDRQEHTEQRIEAIGLADVLTRLPEEQRRVVEYLYLKGYTQSELSDELGIPLGTVKTRTRLALMELRTILKVG